MPPIAGSQPPNACGDHATLADNVGSRVTRCRCGTIHVLIKSSGVTVQLSEERFQQLGLAIMGAVSALGTAGTGSSSTTPPVPPARTIN